MGPPSTIDDIVHRSLRFAHRLRSVAPLLLKQLLGVKHHAFVPLPVMPPPLAGPVLHVQRTVPRVNIEDTFGAFLIGTLFGVMYIANL